MLVLSRKKDQTIKIGENITIMVVEIGPHFVRIGIDAPRDISILRDDAVVETRKPSNDAADG